MQQDMQQQKGGGLEYDGAAEFRRSDNQKSGSTLLSIINKRAY